MTESSTWPRTAPAATPHQTWVAVHAFGNGDTDRLVSDVLPRTVADLRANGQAHGWFYLRYWDGGPHVRVRVRAPAEHDGFVRSELHRAINDHSRHHPSTSWMDDDAYAAMAATMARTEETDHEAILHPPDTVADYVYRPEHHAYGRRAAMAAVETHFEESTELAARVITTTPEVARRRGFALSTGLLTVLACEDSDSPHGGLLEDPTASGLIPRAVVDHLETAYVQQRERLLAQAQALRDMVRHGAGEPGPLSDWLRSVTRLVSALRAAHADGDLDIAPPPSPMRWRDDASTRDRVLTSVVVRCAHLFNNRIGVTYQDEVYVNYLIARVLGHGPPEHTTAATTPPQSHGPTHGRGNPN